MKKKANIIVKSVIGVLLLVGFLLFYNFHLTTIYGKAMEPSLSNEETFVIRKHVSKKAIKRYDIILFNLESNEEYNGDFMVKRVYGLPGETVEIKDGDIYVNNKKIDDPYTSKNKDTLKEDVKKVKLGNDEYYVLSDNRAKTIDSRNSKFGNVKFDEIVGKYAFSLK